jgi:hypothetical protein
MFISPATPCDDHPAEDVSLYWRRWVLAALLSVRKHTHSRQCMNGIWIAHMSHSRSSHSLAGGMFMCRTHSVHSAIRRQGPATNRVLTGISRQEHVFDMWSVHSKLQRGHACRLHSEQNLRTRAHSAHQSCSHQEHARVSLSGRVSDAARR